MEGFTESSQVDAPQARQAQVETLSWGATNGVGLFRLPASEEAFAWVGIAKHGEIRRFLWMLHRKLLKFAWSCVSHQFAGSGLNKLAWAFTPDLPFSVPLWLKLPLVLKLCCTPLLQINHSCQGAGLSEAFWFQGQRDSVDLQNFSSVDLPIHTKFMIWNMQHVFENKKISHSWPKS